MLPYFVYDIVYHVETVLGFQLCKLCNFHGFTFADFSQNYFFRKILLGMANGLDPDQDRRSVSPDLILGPNGLQT